MFRYLSRIKDDLHHQLDHKTMLPRNADQLLSLLIHLSPIEKDYLRLHFRASVWNIGSPNVIFLLQCAHILSMTEYICHQQLSGNNQSATQLTGFDSTVINNIAQPIFDDLLECDARLLANLVQCMGNDTEQGICVTDIISEGIARLFIDLFEQPNAQARNYIREISAHISQSQLEAFHLVHIKFLVMHHQSTVAQAIGLQSKWNAQYDSADSSMLNQLILELCKDRTTLIRLLDMARVSSFTGWLWYLRLIRTMVVSDCEDTHLTTVRQFLRDLFKSFLQQRSDPILHALLVTARQVCGYAKEKRFGSYFHWYKGTFGEMQYTQTVDEFKATMQTLIRSVKYELDMDVLEVHVKTAISAPPKCSELVHSFKQISRSRLMELQDLQLNESIDYVPIYDNSDHNDISIDS